MKFILALIVLAILVIFASAQTHKHPEVLPTDAGTWMSCCHGIECREQQLAIRFVDGGALLYVDNQVYQVPLDKVHRSQNGKSYLCTYGGQPLEKYANGDNNVRCVFYTTGGYV